MSGSFVRGAQTMNSMFFKPVARKTYHKKSTSPDMIRETKKMEAEEVKNKSHMGDTDGHVWIPHERTGIYCPKGQKKVIDDVPNVAGKDFQVNWFSYNDNI